MKIGKILGIVFCSLIGVAAVGGLATGFLKTDGDASKNYQEQIDGLNTTLSEQANLINSLNAKNTTLENRINYLNENSNNQYDVLLDKIENISPTGKEIFVHQITMEGNYEDNDFIIEFSYLSYTSDVVYKTDFFETLGNQEICFDVTGTLNFFDSNESFVIYKYKTLDSTDPDSKDKGVIYADYCWYTISTIMEFEDHVYNVSLFNINTSGE